MINRRDFVLVTLTTASCATVPPMALPAAVPPMWGPLTKGPYTVGFETEWLSREGRAVQVWRWFPAIAGTGTAMTVRDYGKAFVAGGGADWPKEPSAVWATGYDEPGDAERTAQLGDLPVAAHFNARPAERIFPLVVIGQGWAFESPFHQHVLAEYLASWGYRTVSAPLVGPAGRKVDVSSATLSAQMDDLAFIIAQEEHDRGLALIGYDLGGMAVVALAGTGAAQPNVVIGIDTGLMSDKLTADLITSRSEFSWQRLTMPYVHFTRTAAENAARNLPETMRIFEANNGAPRALIRVPQMRHADFGTIGAIEGVIPGLYGKVSGRPDLGYANTVFLIREALEHWIAARLKQPWRPSVRAPVTLEYW